MICTKLKEVPRNDAIWMARALADNLARETYNAIYWSARTGHYRAHGNHLLEEWADGRADQASAIAMEMARYVRLLDSEDIRRAISEEVAECLRGYLGIKPWRC